MDDKLLQTVCRLKVIKITIFRWNFCHEDANVYIRTCERERESDRQRERERERQTDRVCACEKETEK